MLKRLPILIFFIALVALLGAVYVRFIEDDTPPVENPEVVVQPTATLTLTPTELPTATPAPTIPPPPPVEDVVPPVAAQLTEGVVGNIGKLNPLYASYNLVDNDITSLIFEGLTTVNEFGEVVPDLAERWGMSPNGLDYVFALRRDVLWQDGLQFTSADVKYTIDVIRSPDFQGDPNLTQFWRTVEITVIDEFTMRFRLVQPLASFPEYLRIGILPKHVLDGYPIDLLDRHPFNLDPIGTGPYQLDALLADQGRIAGARLRLAPTYQQRAGNETWAIETIIFRTFDTPEAAIAAYLHGDINTVAHIPADTMTRVVGLPHLAIHTTIYPSVGFLIYNWQEEEIGYMQDQRARLALARGIDRVSAVTQTMSPFAVPAQGPLIPGTWAFNSTFAYPTRDIDYAKSIFDSLNYEYTASNAEPTAEAPQEGAPTLEATVEPTAEATTEATTATMRRSFTILVVDKPIVASLAQSIALQWNEIGLSVQVEAVDEATFRQRLNDGDFDTAIVEFTFAPYADPDSYSFWHVGQYQDGLNYGGMKDMRVSEVLEKARRETVGLNRSDFYRQFQEIFAERVPAIPLYYPLFIYLADNRLDGVQLGFITTPADRFRTLPSWHWNLE